MPLWSRLAALGVVLCLVHGCAPANNGTRQPSLGPIVFNPPDAGPDRDRLLGLAKRVTVQGTQVDVGVSEDRTYAIVAPATRTQVVSFLLLEVAAAQVSGCEAVMDPGALDFVPDFTKTSPIVFNSPPRLEIYCPGDTRKRIRGARSNWPGTDAQAARFSDYPVVGNTYLSFDPQHGFQVSYFATPDQSWLWYPRNARGVAEAWKIDGALICYRSAPNTYNPVTKQRGGDFDCTPASLERRQVVAQLPGDPFTLAKGTVPYPRPKCEAPAEFSFDRSLIKC